MSAIFSPLRRVTRHLAVCSISVLLILSAASYAFAPAGEALAAFVRAVAAPAGHQAIEGRVQDGKGSTTIEVVKRSKGKIVIVKTIKVSSDGHFSIPVKTGAYKVIIKDGSKHVTLSVDVKSSQSAFVDVKVTQTSGGLGIAPVIFNY